MIRTKTTPTQRHRTHPGTNKHTHTHHTPTSHRRLCGSLLAPSTRPSGAAPPLLLFGPHPTELTAATPTTITMEGGALSGGQMACAMLFGTAIITYLGLEVSRFRVLVRVSWSDQNMHTTSPLLRHFLLSPSASPFPHTLLSCTRSSTCFYSMSSSLPLSCSSSPLHPTLSPHSVFGFQ